MNHIDLWGVEFYDITNDILIWLQENMGPPGQRYTVLGKTVYFFNEYDKLIFLLNFE